MSRQDLFNKKYEIRDSGCWEWTGCTMGGRYGSLHFPEHPFAMKSNMVSAHRASLYLFKGLSFDSKIEVMHSCDNGLCVNPEYLSLGTHSDNMRDMVSKGRNVNPKQKLTPEDVVEARKLRARGMPVKDIAIKFDISSSRMSKVTAGSFPKWRKKI